jgi:lipopolysaccharide export system permease protein
MTILDRYIARALLTATALVLAVLLALFAVLKFADVLGYVGKGTFSLDDAFEYVALTAPRQIHELFPLAALLGATLALSSLAADSELVAMRAAGISVTRIGLAVLQVGALLAVLNFTLGEWIAPRAEDRAERGLAQSLHRSVREQKEYGVWLRDGPYFVHIGEVLPDLSIRRVAIYDFERASRLRGQLYAESGRYENGKWVLEHVAESAFEGGGVQVSAAATRELRMGIAPDTLSVFAVKPESLSIGHLRRYIEHLARNRQETERYDFAFWNKIATPFASAVMMIFALPFAFASLRSGGVGLRMLLGIVTGLVFFVLTRSAGQIGLLYNVPAVISALLPPLVFFGIALWWLRRVR